MKNWSAALQLIAVGFYVPISMLIPTGVGFWFDKRTAHEFPCYTLIGLIVGTIIMVYGVYQMVRPFLKEAKGATKEEQAQKKGSKSELLQDSGKSEEER